MADPDDGPAFALIKPEHLVTKRPYKKLLSLDGGGIRGLVSAQVLMRLDKIIVDTLWDERDTLFPKEAGEPVYVKADRHIVAPAPGGGTVEIDSREGLAVDLADWFDMLAGTSTGGLLALYLSARGGIKDYTVDGRPLRRGSAAATAEIYKQEGHRIFGTSRARKMWNAITTGAKYQHDSAGLEAVLKGIFGQNETLTQSLKTPTLITSVDVSKARSGAFFAGGAKGGAAGGASGSAGAQRPTHGFIAPVRRSTLGGQVYARVQAKPASRRAVRDLRVGDLALGELQAVDVQEARRGTDSRGNALWLPAVQIQALDFTVWEVARATSAAPGYLPPIKILPVGGDDGTWPRVFVDGGLANNDPAWMALSLMLMLWGTKAADEGSGQQDRPLSFVNTAILSIGTGKAQSCDAWNTTTGGLLHALGLLGQLVSLAMDTTGEDKQRILELIYYGLLRLPHGQYLRVQLPFGDETAAPSTLAPPLAAQKPAPADVQNGKDQQPKAAAPPLAETKSGPVNDDSGALGRPLTLSADEIAAMKVMDDPDPKVMATYEEVGTRLADLFERRLRWWVRCFLLGLDDPYRPH